MHPSSLYRAVWRWHFYAGLIVLPVLVWLAVTGGLYLFKPEIEHFVYSDWIRLQAAAEARPLGELIPAVERQTDGRVTQVMRPASPHESWRMTVDGATAETAFVDPASGRVLGTTGEGGVMETVRALHSLAIAGPIGNALIEIVAGWAILLVLSGFYLWWPRRGNKALALRGRPRERRFWRDFHASTGALAGLVILFLAITGMPWSGVWGETLQGIVTANKLGRPDPPAATPAPGHERHEGRHLPWSLQKAPVPAGGAIGNIGPDRAAAVAMARGLPASFTLILPSRPGRPYALVRTANRADEARVIYVDAANGRILQDTPYARFGAGARMIEWGIYTHQGQQYGEPNRILMLIGCIAVLLLAASAPVLWWKRRLRGRLTEPPAPADHRAGRGVLAIMLTVGAAFPLTGLTMLLGLAVDAVRRHRRVHA